MPCPACQQVNLSMIDRQGIEFDNCLQRQDIRLTCGELARRIACARLSIVHTAMPAPATRHDRYPQRHGESFQKRVTPLELPGLAGRVDPLLTVIMPAGERR